MARWADYGISEVRYNSDRTHIEKVKVHLIIGTDNIVGTANEWSREQVIANIKNGKTFVTILRKSYVSWEKGQDVHIVTVNGVEYIRTDQNRQTADNLENLPEF